MIQTLRDLRETGDEIRSIEGIFSGTLAYLFNVYDGSAPFSDDRARREGSAATPSPIRATTSRAWTSRASSIILGARDGAVRSSWRTSRSRAWCRAGCETRASTSSCDACPSYDARDARALARPRGARQGAALRRRGSTRDGRGDGRARRAATRRTPFANIALTDNVVRFATRRYCDNPLIVQGPGAGPEVTAGGVFADLLRSAPISEREL